MNIIYIFIGAIIALLGYITPRIIGRCFIKLRELHNRKEARYCHYCKQAFTDIWEENWQHCPYCGESLRTIDDDPTEKPFTDF